MGFVKGMLVGAIIGGSVMNLSNGRMHKMKRKMMKNGKNWAKKMNIL